MIIQTSYPKKSYDDQVVVSESRVEAHLRLFFSPSLVLVQSIILFLSIPLPTHPTAGTIFIAINIFDVFESVRLLFLIDFPYNVCDGRPESDIYKIAKLFFASTIATF